MRYQRWLSRSCGLLAYVPTTPMVLLPKRALPGTCMAMKHVLV